MAAFRDIAVWAQTLAEIAAAPNQATRNGPPIAQALSSLQKIGFQDLGGAVEAFRKHGTTIKDSIEATYAHMPPEVRNKVEMVQGRLVNAISSPGVMEFLKRVAEWTMGVDDAFKKRDITLKETARTTYRQLPHEFRDEVEKAHSKVYQIEWNKLAVDIQNWIKAHPYQTAFYVMNGIVFFAPAASSGPVLWTLGFSDKGPKAASFASMLQRKFGTVGAKGIFAHTQSAAMGGYGVTAVDMVTRLGVAASSLLGGMWGSRKSDLSSYDPVELQTLRSEWTTGVDEAFKEHGAILQEPTDSEIALIPENFRDKAKEEHAKWYKIEWEHLPNILKNWILEHPWQTAFHIANGVVYFAPAGASGLVLWALGFTSVGPRAASFASFLQSKIGLAIAKSWFAMFQSVPMGGWGAPIVHTATKIGAFTNGFGVALWGWARGNSTA